MFDGFLMIEFVAYNELGQQVSFGESAASVFGAKRKDWERLLHEQLGTYSGNGCRALDNLIDEMIPELGAPGHKHKVVFTLPVAETKSDIWGEIDGVKLDFTQSADRIKGMNGMPISFSASGTRPVSSILISTGCIGPMRHSPVATSK